MRIFDATDWYWIVAGDQSKVFSSRDSVYVAPDDSRYQLWFASHGGPTFIPSEADLVTLLADKAPSACVPSPAGLSAYAAFARYAKETGGITISGVVMPTDRQTQAQLSGAYAYVQVTPSATIQWKLANGSFVNLTAAQITSIATAVAAHVQACFAAEATVVAQVAAGTITAKAQVDSAFAAVTP